MEENTPEKLMFRQTYKYRGIMLQRSIEIEKILEFYISGVFSKDENKRLEF